MRKQRSSSRWGRAISPLNFACRMLLPAELNYRSSGRAKATLQSPVCKPDTPQLALRFLVTRQFLSRPSSPLDINKLASGCRETLLPAVFRFTKPLDYALRESERIRAKLLRYSFFSCNTSLQHPARRLGE